MTIKLVEYVGTDPAGRAKHQNCSWEQEELTIAGTMIQNDASLQCTLGAGNINSFRKRSGGRKDRWSHLGLQIPWSAFGAKRRGFMIL